MTQKYQTCFNGDTPFTVEVDGNNVRVFDKNNLLILQRAVEKVFIGTSPKNKMTEYSEGYGEEFDGNTILLYLGHATYIYIGNKIYTFNTESEIIKYLSPVGNNIIPYPYAVDRNNNYYLLIENVIISYKPEMDNYNNPYDYFYDYRLITMHMGFIPPRYPKYKYFNNIIEYYVGFEQYAMTYEPYAKNEYLRQTNNNKMYVRKIDENMHEVSCEEYIELMRRFGEMAGFSPLITTPQ